jgi:hypothetical protein
MTYKLFFTKFEYQNNAEFFADFENEEKNVKNLLIKSYRLKKWAKLEFVLLYTSNFQKFLANNFSWVHNFKRI